MVSGTEIIAEFGSEHARFDRPICCTSIDSVFRIAAHEEAFDPECLHRLCAEIAPVNDAGGADDRPAVHQGRGRRLHPSR